MEIRTELNPGDEMFYVDSGLFKKGKVSKIEIVIEPTDKKLKTSPIVNKTIVKYNIDERLWRIEAEVAKTQEKLFDKVKIKD